jgi:hypothetical protein
MALRARVLPALAGSVSSTFWVKKASGMDETPMPAAPPTAQPRADAASCVDAEASKGMRMAQAKAIVIGNALVSNSFKPMSAEQKAVYDTMLSAKYAEERLQREEKKQQQLARATGPGRPVKRPMLLAPEDLDKKGAARQPAGSRAARTPAPFCASSGGKRCCITPGQLGSGWWLCWLSGTCNKSWMQRGCSLRHSLLRVFI